MYEGTLRKIHSTHNNVRTAEMKGEFPLLPNNGRSFVIYGESIDPNGSLRAIHTTPVGKIEKTNDGYLFETRNSKYELLIDPASRIEEGSYSS
jgi:hypothetical protein